jgi:hypothetical protein
VKTSRAAGDGRSVGRARSLGEALLEAIDRRAERESPGAQYLEAELFLPWSAQKLRGEIFANCEVLEERADGEGAFLRVRGEPETVARLREKFSEA